MPAPETVLGPVTRTYLLPNDRAIAVGRYVGRRAPSKRSNIRKATAMQSSSPTWQKRVSRVGMPSEPENRVRSERVLRSCPDCGFGKIRGPQSLQQREEHSELGGGVWARTADEGGQPRGGWSPATREEAAVRSSSKGAQASTRPVPWPLRQQHLHGAECLWMRVYLYGDYLLLFTRNRQYPWGTPIFIPQFPRFLHSRRKAPEASAAPRANRQTASLRRACSRLRPRDEGWQWT